MKYFSDEDRHNGLHLVPKVKRIPPRNMQLLRNTVLIIGGLLIALLGLQARSPTPRAYADPNRFDYVYVLSPMYIYRGNQGVLVMDKRNGNIWFFGRARNLEATFNHPLLVSRLPLEDLDDNRH